MGDRGEGLTTVSLRAKPVAFGQPVVQQYRGRDDEGSCKRRDQHEAQVADGEIRGFGSGPFPSHGREEEGGW